MPDTFLTRLSGISSPDDFLIRLSGIRTAAKRSGFENSHSGCSKYVKLEESSMYGNMPHILLRPTAEVTTRRQTNKQ